VETLRSIGTKEVVVSFVRSGTGDVTESDVLTAQATKAIIFGFNVKTAPVAKRIAEKEHVEVEEYKVIYDLVEATKKRMSALLPKEHIRTDLGTLRLLAIFRTGKGEMIAGGKVTGGVAVRGARVEVMRNDEIFGKGKVTDLQQAKKRTDEVKAGNECGVTFLGPLKLRVGDVLKFYKEEARPDTVVSTVRTRHGRAYPTRQGQRTHPPAARRAAAHRSRATPRRARHGYARRDLGRPAPRHRRRLGAPAVQDAQHAASTPYQAERAPALAQRQALDAARTAPALCPRPGRTARLAHRAAARQERRGA
jgi:hypothetical protein